jgi:hypothetical protein
MYITFEYQRVPDLPFLRQVTKGRPKNAMLYDYHRGEGFVDWPEKVKPYAKGGATLCCIFGDFWMIAGMATCSMSDTFSYEKGKELALLRATNLGLGHELDSGIMYRMAALDKLDDASKIVLLETLASFAEDKSGNISNTMYFHPETAEIFPKMTQFTIKTSKIILKNHVWIGFEE